MRVNCPLKGQPRVPRVHGEETKNDQRKGSVSLCTIKSMDEKSEELKYSFVTNGSGSESKELGGDQWIMDSGATLHYIGNKSLLRNYKPSIDTLTVATGKRAKIEGYGDIIFYSTVVWNGKKTTSMINISNVQYVPGIVVNLLSMSQLDNKGLDTISGKGTWTYLHNGTPVLQAKKESGMWLLNICAKAIEKGINQSPTYCKQTLPRSGIQMGLSVNKVKGALAT